MKLLRNAIIAAVLFPLLASCGGGGGGVFSALAPGSGGGGGGIGGSGVTSSGEVTGFGSIFVNGIEFETDSAEILVNGERVAEEALGLGMVVTVEGTVSEDGRTGDAQRVVFDSTVRGPVTGIAPSDSADQLIVSVLGVEVIVDRRGTVIEGSDFESLDENDLIEVSGFAEADGLVRATRVERISDFVPAQSEIDRTGAVANLTDATFSTGDLTVNYAAADLSALPDGMLTEGLRVLVRGTLSDNTITASAVLPDSDLRSDLAVDEQLVLQGLIADFDGINQFRVNDIPVDASQATVELSSETLGNGLLVQVTGTWDGQQLNADAVNSREGQALIASPIQEIDEESGTVFLGILDATLTTTVTALTLIEDSTGQSDRPSLGLLRRGDYVVVEINRRGNTLAALRISRSRPRDSALRGAVESFTPGTDLVVQGITIATADASLLDAAGEALTPRDFYERLEAGDRVLVIDRQPANGIADVVRLLEEEARSRQQ